MKKIRKNNPTLFDEIIVDNFAGGGGASTGIELALGRPVDIAINHDINAIEMHKANHPFTLHLCESVWDVDPYEICAGRKIALAWFSPDCTHFSKAKGGKPVKKEIRGLAWVVLRWARLQEDLKPRVIMLENVEEFKTWGPLTEDGYPDPEHKGETFLEFVNTLRECGYTVEWKELKACDYGAPTTRKRFVLQARSDGMDIIWPAPTHAPADSKDVKAGKKKPYVPAKDIIDWSIPTKSIFERKKPLSEATLKRIARGIFKYVINNPNPYVLPNNQNEHRFVTPAISVNNTGHPGSCIVDQLRTFTDSGHHSLVTPALLQMGYPDNDGKRVCDIEKPIGTICAQGNKYAMSVATMIQTGYGERKGQLPRVIDIDKPLGTLVSTGKHAVVLAHIDKAYGGNYSGCGSDISKPLDTITAVDHNRLCTAFISKYYSGCIRSDISNIDDPLHTITARPCHSICQIQLSDHSEEVNAFLIKYYGKGIGQGIDEPIHTISSKDHFGLITIHGINCKIVDIGLRMLTPRELYRAQGFPDDYEIEIGASGKKMSKAEQIKRCGNSVCPDLAAALVKANFPEYAEKEKIQTMAHLNERIAFKT